MLAFQNCSKFEDRTYFGKSCYPKENTDNLRLFSFQLNARKLKVNNPITHTLACFVSST